MGAPISHVLPMPTFTMKAIGGGVDGGGEYPADGAGGSGGGGNAGGAHGPWLWPAHVAGQIVEMGTLGAAPYDAKMWLMRLRTLCEHHVEPSEPPRQYE